MTDRWVSWLAGSRTEEDRMHQDKQRAIKHYMAEYCQRVSEIERLKQGLLDEHGSRLAAPRPSSSLTAPSASSSSPCGTGASSSSSRRLLTAQDIMQELVDTKTQLRRGIPVLALTHLVCVCVCVCV